VFKKLHSPSSYHYHSTFSYLSHCSHHLLTAAYDTVTSSCNKSTNCTMPPSGKCQQPLLQKEEGNENDISCSSLAVLRFLVLLCQTVTTDLEHRKKFAFETTNILTACLAVWSSKTLSKGNACLSLHCGSIIIYINKQFLNKKRNGRNRTGSVVDLNPIKQVF